MNKDEASKSRKKRFLVAEMVWKHLGQDLICRTAVTPEWWMTEGAEQCRTMKVRDGEGGYLICSELKSQ